MTPRLHVLISGGGISGLSLALLSARMGIKCSVVERHVVGSYKSIGGGLGLWPASMQVLPADIRDELVQTGRWMNTAGFADSNGQLLARPDQPAFAERFPVLCIERQNLLLLLKKYLSLHADGQAPVTFHENATIERYNTTANGVTATLSTGEIIHADILVAADGINSVIRPREVTPQNMGYTYYRANVDVINANSAWHEFSFEAWGASCKDAGLPLRFGFVSLKFPTVFWFLAVPTKNSPIKPQSGHVSVLEEKDKKLLVDMVSAWRSPNGLPIADLIAATPEILRTDIFKIPNVSSFSWSLQGGRVLLMGDAAHATAPNIAQGAGLCIEDAAVLSKLLSLLPPGPDITPAMLENLAKQYERERKPRAATVQLVADSVALVGQQTGILATFRDWAMKFSLLWVSKLHTQIFESVVAYSLGATSKNASWISPSSQISLLDRVLPAEEVKQLQDHVRRFKTGCFVARRGSGTVNVELSNHTMGRIVASFIGLPKEMNDAQFRASVSQMDLKTLSQVWTRVFGVGGTDQTSYSTTHSVTRDKMLTEGVGGILDPYLKILYSVSVRESGKVLVHESKGVELCGVRFKTNAFSSRWTETATSQGWKFDGKISLGGIGMLMRYRGSFEIDEPGLPSKSRHAIVAGGTGLIGSAVVAELVRRNWRVDVLTRRDPSEFLYAAESAAGVSYLQWDGKTATGWCHAIQDGTVMVNLSGASVASTRWTNKAKTDILQSRLDAIKAFRDAIILRNDVSPTCVQISAAGIAGDSGPDIILDDFPIPSDEKIDQISRFSRFRPQTCKAIEEAAICEISGKVPLTVVRMGHVLSKAGGIFPYFRLAAAARVKRIGCGTQYVPWIHIEDAARGLCTIMENQGQMLRTVNLVAEPTTNEQLLACFGSLRIFSVPESVMKALYGEASCVVLDSERLVPRALENSGFHFEFKTAEDAVRSLL
ncbi:hypothetical protein HDU82_006851 [Entophlyctis luteolus]|nr:hypothetical protein HDU82_006851 [Entophlyctis luteolus]